MDIIDIPRGCGKTSIAIQRAKDTDCPIIVANKQYKSNIMFRLLNNNITDVKVYTIQEWIDKRDKNPNTPVIIDELKMVLNTILNADVEMVTLTSKNY